VHRITQIAVPVPGKHSQPCFSVVFATHQQLAKHGSIVPGRIGHLPVQPPGMIRIRTAVERKCFQLPTRNQMCRSAIIFRVSAIAFAGLSPFGQALAQFMMVWQR
jgi:hypothetical protein